MTARLFAAAQPEASGLPHAYPFALVDRVLMLEPGRWAVTLTNVTLDAEVVASEGGLPAVLVAEALAQCAGLAAAPPNHASTPGAPALLVRLDRFRCRPPIPAGAQLVVVARLVRRLGANAMVRAVATVSGRVRGAGDVVLHFPWPRA